MKENEFQKCLNKYFYETQDNFLNILCPKGNEKISIKHLLKIFNNFNEIKLYDKPDGYIITKKYIYIFEHFEIDATNNSKKGSQSRREENRIDRKFKNIKVNKQNEMKTILETYDITISIENLVENFKNICQDHHNKIESYKNNLIKKGIASLDSKFKICFVIEDVTPLGTFYLNNFKRTTLRISNIKECLNFLQKNIINVDYYFLLNQYDNEKNRYFFKKSFIKDMKRFAIKQEDIKMINWKPNEVRFEFTVPFQNE